MFSNTAYNALYKYLGLSLHSRLIEILTSEIFFQAVILTIFAVMFFLTSIKFFSRNMPGIIVKKKFIPLSAFVKIIVCLFLGLSLLKVSTKTSIYSFSGKSWHNNSYVKRNMEVVKPSYKVSLIFDLLSTSAEQFSRFLSEIIDKLFQKTHSQLKAPNFFFKAIMYAGAATIDDQNLKDNIKFYTEECFDKILPLINSSSLDGLLNDNTKVDDKLEEIVLEDQTSGDNATNNPLTCLEIKKQIQEQFFEYTKQKTGKLKNVLSRANTNGNSDTKFWTNLYASNALVNYYMDKRESYFGIRKGSIVSNGSAKIFHFLNRLKSWDGLLSIFGGRKHHGASMAAERAQAFSENLSRAPHLSGFIQLILIALFPVLVFFVVAGRWKAIVYWYIIYLSVLLWTPLWTLLYHIITNISLSTEVMQAVRLLSGGSPYGAGTVQTYGAVNDGISLYSAKLISSRMNYMFAVYSWLQVLLGPIFTAFFAYKLLPLLSDTQTESAPEFVEGAKSVASTTASVASGGLSKLVT